MKKLADALSVALAVLAAIVAVRLAMGLNAWAWICAYWIVNTARNAIDARGRLQ